MEDFTTVLNLEECLKHSEASFFSAKSNCASFNSNMTLNQQKSYCKQSKILGLCLLARRYKRLQEKAIYFALSSFSRESHTSENYHTLIGYLGKVFTLTTVCSQVESLEGGVLIPCSRSFFMRIPHPALFYQKNTLKIEITRVIKGLCKYM